MIKRRQFLRAGLAGAGAVLASRVSFPLAWAQSGTADSRIEVLVNEPLGSISPNLYGHFTENLSGVVYDGIWVGANSKVPNIDGIRKDLIDESLRLAVLLAENPLTAMPQVNALIALIALHAARIPGRIERNRSTQLAHPLFVLDRHGVRITLHRFGEVFDLCLRHFLTVTFAGPH